MIPATDKRDACPTSREQLGGSALRIRRLTGKPHQLQALNVVGFQGVTEILGTVHAPRDADVLQQYVARVFDEDTGSRMRDKTGIVLGVAERGAEDVARTTVVPATGPFGPLVHFDPDVVEDDVFQRRVRATGKERAVLAPAEDVTEPDLADPADGAGRVPPGRASGLCWNRWRAVT